MIIFLVAHMHAHDLMQAVLYKCVAPARVAWRCAPELSKRFANVILGSLIG